MCAYDSTADTLRHIKRINELLINAAKVILDRAKRHDASKLSDEEKPGFDEWSPKLKIYKFGTKEYADTLAGLRSTLEHHYANNSHHPEHYENGIDGFCLFDLMEMFFDWKASSERNAGGNIKDSIRICKERFGLSDQLFNILNNTADRYEDILK